MNVIEVKNISRILVCIVNQIFIVVTVIYLFSSNKFINQFIFPSKQGKKGSDFSLSEVYFQVHLNFVNV